MNIVSSAFGHYEAVGDPAEADVIIGQSFGTHTDELSVNYAIAEQMAAYSEGRPMVADRMLADAFPNGDEDVDHVVEGPITNTVGQGVGSWGILVGTKEYMEEHGFESPLLVAQAYHVGRVVRQAHRLGMHPIVPADLPRQWEPRSEQPWTRSLGLWVPREVVGSLVLRAQGKL